VRGSNIFNRPTLQYGVREVNRQLFCKFLYRLEVIDVDITSK